MIYWSSLTCLLVLPVALGYDFSINVNLPTVRNGARKFIVDTTVTGSFVMDYATFNKSLGVSNTYNPLDSYAFINKSRPYNTWARDSKGDQYLRGYTAEDAFELAPKKGVRHPFGVIRQADSVLPVQTIDGKSRVGRLGFYEASQWTTSILWYWFGYFKEERVCLHITESEDLKVKESVVAIGVKVPEERLLFKYNNRMSKGWKQISISDFLIDGENTKFASSEAIIASASSEIILARWTFDSLVQRLNATQDQSTKDWMVACDRIKTFGFTLGYKHKLEIPFERLVHKESADSKLCRLLFARGAATTQLGIPVFTNLGMCMDHKNGDLHVYDASYKKDSAIFADAKDYGAFVDVNPL